MTAIAAPAAPLDNHSLLVFLLQVAVLLALAVALGRLAARFGLPAVVGEMLAGVLLGPSLLGWLAPQVSGWLLPADPAQAHLLDAVAQLGVLLLVGVTGAHLDTRLLGSRRVPLLGVSVGALLLPLGLGVAVGLLAPAQLHGAVGGRTVFALFVGTALCVSAIPVIAKTFADMGLQHRDVAHLTLGAATVDDAFGWLLLSGVSMMAISGLQAARLMRVGVLLVGLALLPLVAGRMRWGGGRIRAVVSGGYGVAAIAAFLLLAAAGSQALGLEPVFGAFVAGMVVSSTRVVTPAAIAPLRTVVLSVLAPIFLATAGLRLDLTVLRSWPLLVAGAVALVVAVAGKLTGAYLGARLTGLSHWEGVALGAGLNARGVTEVVVANVGLRLGVLNQAAYTIVVLIAVLTSLMAPPLLRLAIARLEPSARERTREAEFTGHPAPDARHATPAAP